MGAQPLVSILIPTYNQKEAFLRECIESAVNQTYQNTEIIISDNFSTNNAPSVIEEYRLKDKRIKVVRPPEFLNITESFLFVFTQASGELSCYVSSDDILRPQCIEILAGEMSKNEEIIFAHGKARYFEKDNSGSIRWDYFNNVAGAYGLNEDAAKRIVDFQYICFGGCVVNNRAWNNVISRIKNNRLEVDYSLDILLILLLFSQGKIYYSTEVLVEIRLENETRNARLPFLVKDALAIRNFIGNDPVTSSLILRNSIDLDKSRREHYIIFHKELLIQFGKGYFDTTVFKTVLKELEGFNIKTPLLYRLLDSVAIHFPKLSIRLFSILKALRG